jgi:hypothetical protein
MAREVVAAGLQRAGEPGWMVGVDVGGTFTDAIAIAEDGDLRTAKVASTPADPSAGFEQALCGLSAAGAAPGQVRLLGHGTTVRVLWTELIPGSQGLGTFNGGRNHDHRCAQPHSRHGRGSGIHRGLRP